VIIHNFSSDCVPDLDFGHDGVATIAFPKLPHSERYTITAINAISPARGGGIILVGQTTGGWLVGELAQNGRLDSTFGHGGWTVLPWSGQAAAVLQEPSGKIIVAGEAGAGCCVKEWVSALTSSGTLDEHFGVDGRVGIPSGEDSGVSRLALEPNGDILALTGAGNMGCWDDLVAALTPNGLPVAGFLDNFGTTWRSELVPQGVSTGDLVVRGAGFVLVGTRQQTCVSNTADPTAGGHMAVFDSDGKLETSFATGGVATFSSPMQGEVWAFSAAGGDVLMLGMPAPVQVENSDSTEALDLVALLPNGEVDSRYGAGGRAQVQLASLLNDSPGSFVPVTVAGEGKWIAIVSSTANGKGLQLIRIRS
jgi:hypothetical protein